MTASSMDNGIDGSPDQDGTAVRERILNAAWDLFSRKGFEATSVREIVDAVKVTRPILYYYFQSKEGLYLDLLERLCASVENSILSSMVSEGSTRARLRSFVENILDSIIEDANSQRPFLNIIMDPRLSILSAFRERIRNFIASILDKLLEDGIGCGEFTIEDVGHIRRAILAYIVSFTHNQIFFPDSTANREETIRLLDSLLDQIDSRGRSRG